MNQETKQFQVACKKEEDPQKTPSIKIQCNKHGKEIIMFNFNPDETQFLRLACIECIQSNVPIKYTTISDANFKWNDYLELTSYQVQRFQNQRNLKSTKIIQILGETKDKHNQIMSEIINKLKSQNLITPKKLQ